MAKKNPETTPPVASVETKPPARAVAAAALGVAAAWFAAGSAGFLVHSLENTLVIATLLVALVCVWPAPSPLGRKRWIAFGGLAVCAALMSQGDRVAAVCGVGLALAAFSAGNRGLTGRVLLLAAAAVGVLAVFRLACGAIPLVWHAADALGYGLGSVAAVLTGRPLWIGATFAGVDLLVVMLAIWAGWLAVTEPPRLARGLRALGAIAFAEFLYLTTLAFADRLAQALPAVIPQNLSDMSFVGTWYLADALRSALPWNLPLLAAAIFGMLIVAMLRQGTWKVISPISPSQERPPRELAALGAAAAVAALLPLAVVYSGSSSGKCDLKGKTVVGFEYGYLFWQRPEMGRADPPPRSYGMLPMLVERMGGKFFRSLSLSDDDLKKADVLVVIHPDTQWPEETKQRVLDYVRRGGSLLLAAEPVVLEGQSRSDFAQLLDGTSIRVRYDTCLPAADYWEGCYDGMAHPASIGIDGNRNRFGILLASSLAVRWPASPVTAARFGHCEPGSDANTSRAGRYEAGKKLGDLVLAAEQPYGKGRIFVLGDTGPLNNNTLPCSYEYVGRILAGLSDTGSAGPQAWWRELLGVALAAGIVLALFWQADALRVAVVLATLVVSLLAASSVSRRAGAVMPDGRGQKPNDVAYIDASHLNAYSPNPWSNMGMGRLCRMLCRAGYLPLMLDETSAERLDRAGVLLSAAPMRPFTADETKIVDDFVSAGGLLVACCGAEESAGSRSLLESFQYEVMRSPIRPGDPSFEPAPLGECSVTFGDFKDPKPSVAFYAAWPIEMRPGESSLVALMKADRANTVVSTREKNQGDTVWIADSFFAVNANLPGNGLQPSGNERFWRWLLGEGLGRELPARAQPQSTVVPEPDAVLEPDASLGDDAGKGDR